MTLYYRTFYFRLYIYFMGIQNKYIITLQWVVPAMYMNSQNL